MNLNNIKLLISAGREDQFPKEPLPHIVFSGKSNVGKSSLINTLLGRKSLARVSSAPGKTITINFYEIDEILFFVDLPGYGYAKRSYESKEVWSALTDSYLTGSDKIALVLQLIDMKAGASENDKMMLQWLAHNNIPHIIVGTKSDKLNKTQLSAALAALQSDRTVLCPIIPFSSLTSSGKDEVWGEIKKHI